MENAYGRFTRFNQPEMGQRRINIFGSLTKATDFDCEYLYIDFEFDFPSTRFTIINNNKKETLKYSTNCGYYMKTNNQKIYNFSSIFELEIIETISNKNDFDLSPKIYFEVNSVDYWNRHRIEGYGLFNIDFDQNMNKDISVQIWRPIGTIREEITRFFIGGGIKLKDKKSISIPKSKENNHFNARFKWNTISTGTIHLKMNTIKTYNEHHINKKEYNFDDIPTPKNIINSSGKHHKKIHSHKRKHHKKSSKLSKLITLSSRLSKNVDIQPISNAQQSLPSQSLQTKTDRQSKLHKRRKKKSKLLQKVSLNNDDSAII